MLTAFNTTTEQQPDQKQKKKRKKKKKKKGPSASASSSPERGGGGGEENSDSGEAKTCHHNTLEGKEEDGDEEEVKEGESILEIKEEDLSVSPASVGSSRWFNSRRKNWSSSSAPNSPALSRVGLQPKRLFRRLSLVDVVFEPPKPSFGRCKDNNSRWIAGVNGVDSSKKEVLCQTEKQEGPLLASITTEGSSKLDGGGGGGKAKVGENKIRQASSSSSSFSSSLEEYNRSPPTYRQHQQNKGSAGSSHKGEETEKEEEEGRGKIIAGVSDKVGEEKCETGLVAVVEQKVVVGGGDTNLEHQQRQRQRGSSSSETLYCGSDRGSEEELFAEDGARWRDSAEGAESHWIDLGAEMDPAKVLKKAEEFCSTWKKPKVRRYVFN